MRILKGNGGYPSNELTPSEWAHNYTEQYQGTVSHCRNSACRRQEIQRSMLQRRKVKAQEEGRVPTSGQCRATRDREASGTQQGHWHLQHVHEHSSNAMHLGSSVAITGVLSCWYHGHTLNTQVTCSSVAIVGKIWARERNQPLESIPCNLCITHK